jgi:cytochrome c-type biogenesis protein CcmH
MRARLLTRPAALLVAAVLGAGPGAATASATALPAHRASLTKIYDDVMCVVCHEPLALAQSPEAEQERAYIRKLVNQGETVKQVEAKLVTQYGAAVLALPPAHGFNLLVYVIPPLVVLLGIGVLALTLPKWRARSRVRLATPPAARPAIDAADARRLEEDLARRA